MAAVSGERRMVVVPETSVWVDYFKDARAPYVDTLRRCLGAVKIATTDVIIREVLQGFRFDRDYEAARGMFDEVVYVPFHGRPNMELTASNYRLLRRKGVTIRKPNDVLIGTFCVENGFALLHNDRDFDPMEKYLGLRVVH